MLNHDTLGPVRARSGHPMEIRSHKGPYQVDFVIRVADALAAIPSNTTCHFIIDDRVADLYATDLKAVLDTGRVVRVAANEDNKSLEKMPDLIEELLSHQIRRDQWLVGIGGGIIQDITCFVAANLFRGMNWMLIPTTLLAQADSCIGSKSSINLGQWKNLLGTFTPPQKLAIATDFQKTLDPNDVRSGIGEMIKVHVIDGPESFAKIESDYDDLFSDPSVMEKNIVRSLEIKKGFIEADEFDKGIRNLMNYGHSFGHAIESATHFAVPHGVAVTIGMDMANFVAWKMGRISEKNYLNYTRLLRKNAGGFYSTEIPLDTFIAAIAKDKKNVGAKLSLILLNDALQLERVAVANDETFRTHCRDFFSQTRN